MKAFAVSVVLVAAVAGLSAGCQSRPGSGALLGATGAQPRAGEGAAVGAVNGAVGDGSVEPAAKEPEPKPRAANPRVKSDGAAVKAAAFAAPQPGAVEGSDARPLGKSPAKGAGKALCKDDVIGWAACGVRDAVIIDRIEQSRAVFRLTAADENQLRDAGVSEEVIRAMRDTARRATAG